MVEEIRKLLLYLKRSTGKFDFSESEVLNVLSIRTRFLTPEEVKEFLKIAVENRCLNMDNDRYTITCSINGIDLSLDYKPDFQAIKNEGRPDDVFGEIVKYITENTKLTKREVVAEINKIRERNPFISVETASLIVAKFSGLSIEKFLDGK
jgi:hypothetical protein